MNCTRVALYDITSGSYDDIVKDAQAGMVPIFERSPGFVSYGVAQVDENSFVSMSTWNTSAQAADATAKAAAWVKDNSRDHFALRANYTGELAIDVHGR